MADLADVGEADTIGCLDDKGDATGFDHHTETSCQGRFLGYVVGALVPSESLRKCRHGAAVSPSTGKPIRIFRAAVFRAEQIRQSRAVPIARYRSLG